MNEIHGPQLLDLFEGILLDVQCSYYFQGLCTTFRKIKNISTESKTIRNSIKEFGGCSHLRSSFGGKKLCIKMSWNMTYLKIHGHISIYRLLLNLLAYPAIQNDTFRIHDFQCSLCSVGSMNMLVLDRHKIMF